MKGMQPVKTGMCEILQDKCNSFITCKGRRENEETIISLKEIQEMYQPNEICGAYLDYGLN